MKPIAKFGQLPFNVGGINVFAAVDNNKEPISDKLYIVGERSTRVFDLITEDQTEIFSFMTLVGQSTLYSDLPLDATKDEIEQLIGKNQFVVKVFDLNSGDPLGYAYKFFPNKIILSNGKEVLVENFNTQTTTSISSPEDDNDEDDDSE